MSSFDIVSKLFHEHIEHLSLSADAIADVCDQAASLIANAIISEKKLFSIGMGLDKATAVSFSHLIRDGVWLERPNLPVVELTADRAQSINASAAWVAREITSLGQSDDVAVIWGSQLSSDSIALLYEVAEERGVQLVWIGAQGPSMSLSFSESENQTTYGLTALTAITLARAVEHHLFGA